MSCRTDSWSGFHINSVCTGWEIFCRIRWGMTVVVEMVEVVVDKKVDEKYTS